jgi:Phosphotransferase enzyme family
MGSLIPSQPKHVWLAAILPENARSFRVQDPALAATLADAGAVLVDESADVEIAEADALRGDADRGVVALARMAGDDVSYPGRVAARLAGPLALRRDIRSARSALQRHGYTRIEAATWDYGRPLRLSDEDRRRATLHERLPRNAVLVGERSRAQASRTLLEAVMARAGESLGTRIEHPETGARAGILVTVASNAVLRVAVGPARTQLTSQAEALESLRDAACDALDKSVIPWTTDRGRLGLADWSLEPKLHGATPGWELDSRVVGAALDFLAGLHSCRNPSIARRTPADDAEVAASFVDDSRSAALRMIGRKVAEKIAELPYGFAHGDFFTRNILVEGPKIVGVVDWDAGGPNRPPLLDFLHLWHMGRRKIGDLEWGPSIVSDLLPWAREGGDDVLRTLARRIDVDVSPSKLEALVIAYWLARLRYQLSRYADRTERPVWMQQNVDSVLHALSALGWR